MNEPQPIEKFKNAWGFILVAVLIFTSMLLIKYSVLSYPNFPFIPQSIWLTYFFSQILSVIPIGHRYENSKINNFGIACHIFCLMLFVIAMLFRESIPRELWIFSTVIILSWLALRIFITLKNKIPFSNLATVLVCSTATTLPMVIICILAVRNSA
jgi:hypothetical protein